MKKIIATIIVSILTISNSFIASAENGKIVDLFDLYHGVEEFSLGLVRLEPVTFQNSSIQRTYDEFVNVDVELKKTFIKQYRNGEIDYYQMQDLITAYENFVYYTGKTFSYIAEQEAGLISSELDYALKNSYSNMRSSYARVFHIMSK